MLTVTLLCGRALGGGAELTTATDVRLVTNNAAVTFVQGKMGLRSEEHTSELQSLVNLVCRLLLEKKNKKQKKNKKTHLAHHPPN